jgi:endonuclease/exonuclease/phosphatase family metal-dependent hydrolase
MKSCHFHKIAKAAALLAGITLSRIAGTAQSLPIVVDGIFDEWQGAAALTDPSGDGNTLDFLSMELSNDAGFLFIRFKLSQEILLTDGNAIFLYLDTDANALTGEAFNGLGAEAVLDLGQREATVYTGSFPVNTSLNDLKWRHLPTVTGQEFEIAIGRNTKPGGTNLLFSGPAIRLAFQDGSTADGDRMPGAGQIFTYEFDETPVTEPAPVPFEKNNSLDFRLMTYNTFQNGLDDFERVDNFRRVVSAAQPGVVTFNECWDVTAGMAATFMNTAIPLPNFQNWNAVKVDYGNITVSRYPILQSWEVEPGVRITASLIDLPAEYATDILVINGHLKCCNADNTRQKEVDALIRFLLDAKTPGGVIDLPENTPFVLSGDLNLVGEKQQLTTLLTGQVVNTAQYGPGGPPDWDGTGLEDVIARHSDLRMAYTWKDEWSSFTPSRLDYHIFSNSAMSVSKSFTIQTEVMPPERLTLYGLQQNDTGSASDHFPKVTDFQIPVVTATAENLSDEVLFAVSPNPFFLQLKISRLRPQMGELDVSVLNTAGQLMGRRSSTAGEVVFETAVWPSGIYFIKIMGGEQLLTKKTVKP